MFKILITGPESSGKSVLSKELASFYNGGLVVESARAYLKEKVGYQESDLLKIAQLQKQNEKALISTGKYSLVFCDTGVEVIKIWSQEKYGRVDAVINKLNQLESYDLVLLCKPNIPWEKDPLREHPNDRMRLFEIYLNELKQAKASFFVIDETIHRRVEQAKNIVSRVANLH